MTVDCHTIQKRDGGVVKYVEFVNNGINPAKQSVWSFKAHKLGSRDSNSHHIVS